MALLLKRLKTERPNRTSANLDRMSALEVATLMNQQDANVARSIKKSLPQIARAIEIVANKLVQGGRLIYVGTGTSGRIGALDASECPGTFGIGPERVQFVIAGGEHALVHSTEASEDSSELGWRDMARKRPGKRDVVVGIAASGRTPYTLAALEYARRRGSSTIAVVCNLHSALAAAAELAIEVEVGPEVLTGSTRLKAGTAQKLICNMLTTCAMTQIGYVYGNLMVNLDPKNGKLVERAITIIESVAEADRESARSALEAARMKVPVAIVMLKAGVGRSEAVRRLRGARGNVRRALERNGKIDLRGRIR